MSEEQVQRIVVWGCAAQILILFGVMAACVFLTGSVALVVGIGLLMTVSVSTFDLQVKLATAWWRSRQPDRAVRLTEEERQLLTDMYPGLDE